MFLLRCWRGLRYGVVVLLLCGCANQLFVFDRNAGVNDTGPFTQHYWLWGLGQSDEIDAAEVCKGAKKIANVRLHTSLTQFAATVLTLGIYSPREVTIRCLR